MVSRQTVVVAWMATALSAGLFLLAAAGPLAEVTLSEPASVAKTSAAAARSPRAADSLVRALVGANPFRAARRPVATEYDPVTFGQPEPPPVPLPVLSLTGVVDGPDPTAVIEGLPGTDGARVVRVGDIVGVLRIRAIGNGTVRIVGMDTSWVLSVRMPW